MAHAPLQASCDCDERRQSASPWKTVRVVASASRGRASSRGPAGFPRGQRHEIGTSHTHEAVHTRSVHTAFRPVSMVPSVCRGPASATRWSAGLVHGARRQRNRADLALLGVGKKSPVFTNDGSIHVPISRYIAYFACCTLTPYVRIRTPDRGESPLSPRTLHYRSPADPLSSLFSCPSCAVSALASAHHTG